MIGNLSVFSALLALNGLILMILGLYFIFFRPPLLPEDQRFMGTSLEEIRSSLPGLLVWLRRVFWVMGGFMFATGLLIASLALTTLRVHSIGGSFIVALAGLSSIGWMAVVNLVIDSNFKWLILVFNIPWIAAVILSWT